MRKLLWLEKKEGTIRIRAFWVGHGVWVCCVDWRVDIFFFLDR